MVTMASLAGLVFFGCGVYLWFRDNGGRSAERKKVGLEHISGIWTPHKKKIMQLEQLVPIWRETHSEGQPGDGEESIGLQLEHQGLRQFYNDHIRLNPFITGNVLVVIEKCLSLLDKEGSCPSVVNLRGDPEALLEKNAYTMLGKTNLIDHTLHVAEEMIDDFVKVSDVLNLSPREFFQMGYSGNFRGITTDVSPLYIDIQLPQISTTN